MIEGLKLGHSQRLLRLPEVRNRVGMSRSTIYRKVADGTFPHPRKLGPSIVAWLEEDIAYWISNLSAN